MSINHDEGQQSRTAVAWNCEVSLCFADVSSCNSICVLRSFSTSRTSQRPASAFAYARAVPPHSCNSISPRLDTPCKKRAPLNAQAQALTCPAGYQNRTGEVFCTTTCLGFKAGLVQSPQFALLRAQASLVWRADVKTLSVASVC